MLLVSWLPKEIFCFFRNTCWFIDGKTRSHSFTEDPLLVSVFLRNPSYGLRTWGGYVIFEQITWVPLACWLCLLRSDVMMFEEKTNKN